ncbi:MAG: Nif3-like dinuclear metal center hexameric protein [Gracilibacteraceae bacterium]|nr:Nif3-like dinuclear metal center hexameric protein [Gracilibacteraceae bacterium]
MAVSVGSIAQAVEEKAPRSWAEEWDNAGLLVGSYAQQVDKVLMVLDGTQEVVEEAVEVGAQLIMAHHPLMLKPLQNLRKDNRQARLPLALLQNHIAYYAAHTNLDQSEFSSSLNLANLAGVIQPELLSETAEQVYKIATFVPVADAETLRLSLARAGVGKGFASGAHGECYEECFFQVQGQGMFRAAEGADPAVGQVGELTRVEETRLESIVTERNLKRAVRVLLQEHPYEEPAYDVIRQETPGQSHGYGAVGELLEPMPLGVFWEEFLRKLPGLFAQDYDLSAVRVTGDMRQRIRKIAVANGSAGSMLPKALARGADLFITGDLSYHQVLDALEEGMAVIELGHFLSEIPMIQSLRDYLAVRKEMSQVEWVISQKNKGLWARI